MPTDENGNYYDEDYNPDQAFNGQGEDTVYGTPDQGGGGSNNDQPQQDQPTSQPKALTEDYFKEKTSGAGAYDPNVYQEYLKDPSQSWADRLVNKENLRADNETGSAYTADNKGGYLTAPKKPAAASKILGGAGGDGSWTGSGNNARGDEVYGYLKGLFPGGGFNQDIVNRRVDSARSGLEAQRKQALANNEAYLADRGLIGSGPQATANENLESRLFGQFGSAYNDIYANESENADQRMTQALQMATGMSEADAQRQIDWYRANTENKLGFGNLNARNTEIGNNFILGGINADIGRQNANTASYSAQMDYDIATKKLADAERDYNEAVRVHDDERANEALKRKNEAAAILAQGTHK